MDFNKLNSEISPPDEAFMEIAAARWNSIAKPVGSLGLLEDAVIKIAGITGAEPDIEKRSVIVLCSDNGVVSEGVASTPADITAVMAEFIAQGRSSVGIMAKCANARVVAVDMGMMREVDTQNLLDRRIARGTMSMMRGPAMTIEQTVAAIQAGIDLVKSCKESGDNIVATGEMGIGNTTTSSAMAAVLLNRSVEEVTGVGAGLTDEGLQRKIEVIKKAIKLNNPDPENALEVMAALGGFDIAGMCGIYLGGALYRIPILIDGIISAIAALAAMRLCPASQAYMIASHESAEPAARLILGELGIKPLIKAEMRLGEGTGAVAALPLLDMAIAVYRSLMTFEDIGMV